MLEGLKESLEYMVGLGRLADKPQVLDICGKTYANRQLVRYGSPERAEPIVTSSLSSLVEYIGTCSQEFPEGGKMILHVVNPKTVRLISGLDAERERECLFECRAEIAEFQFGSWYDQERFMIEMQADFQPSPDLDAILKLAGNVERKNNQTYSDDGRTQVATMQVGVASKADVIVPNPVTLIPNRTFQEVEQPASSFVFRIGDREEPAFSLFEAEGGLWKNEAVRNIKNYLKQHLEELPEELGGRMTIIG